VLYFQKHIFNFSNNKTIMDRSNSTGGEMESIQKRIQRAAESILENEALTSDLDDEAAQELLDWGIACAEKIVNETADLDDEAAEEAMYQPMRSLRKMLRAANKWAADPQAGDLKRITKQAAKALDSNSDEEQQASFLTTVPEDATTRVQALRSFIEGDQHNRPEAI
jgi:hypothetical protein